MAAVVVFCFFFCFFIACRVGALWCNLRVTGKFSPCQWLCKLLKQHFLYSFQIICALREKTKHKTTTSYFTEIKKASVFIFLGLLSVSLLSWISIRSLSHVIDFQPVTFRSGIVDVHTGLLFLVFFFFTPPPLLVSTPPHVHALNYNRGHECNLCNSFRPHDPPLIVVLLTQSARGALHGHRAITKSLLQPLQLKSDMGTNEVFCPS